MPQWQKFGQLSSRRDSFIELDLSGWPSPSSEADVVPHFTLNSNGRVAPRATQPFWRWVPFRTTVASAKTAGKQGPIQTAEMAPKFSWHQKCCAEVDDLMIDVDRDGPCNGTTLVNTATSDQPRSAEHYDQATEAMLTQIRDSILKAAELLPSQGPITGFAFLNPLQGLEHLPMSDALRQVKQIYHCEPYLSEDRYRQYVASGRIGVEELTEVVDEDLQQTGSERIAGLATRRELRLHMLQHPLHTGDARELAWVIAETEALQSFLPDTSPVVRERIISETQQWVSNEQAAGRNPDHIAQLAADSSESWEHACLNHLFHTIHQNIEQVDITAPVVSVSRPAELLKQIFHIDCDALVHQELITFCAAFLDQGFAHWRLPKRDRGFFAAYCSIVTANQRSAKRWMKGLAAEIDRIQAARLTPLQVIQESLQLLGVTVEQQPDFLRDSLLALRGFCGMLWQNEFRSDRVHFPCPKDTLVEFMAVRLLLDRFALEHLARNEIKTQLPLSRLQDWLLDEQQQRHQERLNNTEQLAYTIFQIAQFEGWLPQQLTAMSSDDWQALADEVRNFSDHERRRLFHAAFERQLVRRTLDSISLRAALPQVTPAAPELQVICCIDAREESFRRHIEETNPDVETFGTAGFFGIPMYFRSAGDAHFSALCPIVMKPQHWVVEDVVYAFEEQHNSRARARRAIGEASHRLHVGTRTSVLGAFVSTALGPLATVPLVSRILFPRMTAQMHRTVRKFVSPPAITRLRLERSPNVPPGPTESQIGFTLDELCAMGERALRDIGLTETFSPLVIVLGHGTTCLNNPHESAYHCGACAGNAGGPNARALAVILNDPRVRRRLAANGLDIPEDTWFIGGLHNTATEEITFFDLELLPTRQIAAFRAARELFEEVAQRNAHERCRRFESAALDLTPQQALRHAQDRTENLAQTRPEYGNGTNAVCFAGRRSRIRGLFLDRRSFLMSYDSAQDNNTADILARILGAVIPVCAGINLLYTFSAIDPAGWGSGSKLPHNVTSLLGVMDGASSDLRPGLPWQGVDIHEPVRLLFVIECSPDKMLSIMDRNPAIDRIVRNAWAQVATLDPVTTEIHLFRDGQFVLYPTTESKLQMATSSADCYRGHRDNRPFSMIGEA